jgi:transcriptional regulator with XRE-family HTH domain
MRQVALPAGLNVATLATLEAGTNLSPQPSTLRAIAGVLQLDLGQLYTELSWLPPQELPSLALYLRAKYRDLDEQAIADIQAYANQRVLRHGGTGPIDREDEQP